MLGICINKYCWILNNNIFYTINGRTQDPADEEEIGEDPKAKQATSFESIRSKVKELYKISENPFDMFVMQHGR